MPSGSCVSAVTLDNIEPEEAHIAIGTLDNYGCYIIEDLLMVPDDYQQLIANLPELIKFARYSGSIELEQKLLRIELGSDYFNELRKMLMSKSTNEIGAVLDALTTLSLIFHRGVCTISTEQVERVDHNVAIINIILPDLKSVKKVGTRFIAINIKFSDIIREILEGTYCITHFGEISKELADTIAAVYYLKYIQRSSQ